MRFIQFPLDQGSPASISAKNDFEVGSEWLPSNIGQMAVDDDFDPTRFAVDLTTMPFSLVPIG